MSAIGNYFGSVGQKRLNTLRYLGGLMSLFFYSLIKVFSFNKEGKYYIKTVLTAQVFFTAAQAITIINIIGAFFGATIVFIVIQMGNALPMFSVEKMLPPILNLVFLRELGPLLTAIIVIARSGTAIAAEIGNMLVNNETDALESMGIDTLKFLILPRIMGMIVSLVLLNLYFNFTSIFGGALLASLLDSDVSFFNLMSAIVAKISLLSAIEFLVKSLFFGAGISTICLMSAFLEVKGQSRLVPVAATKGVVNSLIYIFFVNAILTVLFILANPIAL